MDSQRLLSTLQRHDLLRIDPESWSKTLRSHGELAALAPAADWAAKGWPVIVRRRVGRDLPGMLPAAIALPPALGKLRIGLQIDPKFVRERICPPGPAEVRDAAPLAWRSVLDDLARIAISHGARLSIFGSLMWQALTGLDYLTGSSDLDLIWRVTDTHHLSPLLDAIAAVDARGAARIDGEIVFPDGAGVNWREVARRPRDVLIKTMHGIECRPLNMLFEESRSATA